MVQEFSKLESKKDVKSYIQNYVIEKCGFPINTTLLNEHRNEIISLHDFLNNYVNNIETIPEATESTISESSFLKELNPNEIIEDFKKYLENQTVVNNTLLDNSVTNTTEDNLSIIKTVKEKALEYSFRGFETVHSANKKTTHEDLYLTGLICGYSSHEQNQNRIEDKKLLNLIDNTIVDTTLPPLSTEKEILLKNIKYNYKIYNDVLEPDTKCFKNLNLYKFTDLFFNVMNMESTKENIIHIIDFLNDITDGLRITNEEFMYRYTEDAMMGLTN
jgi:hypothetical protein